MKLEETPILQKEAYTCPIFAVSEDVVRLADGKEVPRNRIIHNGGSGVLAITEQNEVILVEQYRYGVRQVLLEIPAGKLEKGEAPIDCALRELREEVGARCDELISLGSIAVTPAYDSEIIYIYLARPKEFIEQKLDEDEFLKVHRIPFDTALSMVESGEITDAKTQIALMKAKLFFSVKKG